jgi:hypothetical protein
VSARCIHSFVHSFIHSFKKRGKSAVETGEGKKKTKELLFENLKAARYLLVKISMKLFLS